MDNFTIKFNKTNNMRKLIFAAVIIAGSISSMSCTKDYTCTCVTTVNNIQTASSSTTIKNTSEADAKNTCDASDGTYVDCEIVD